MNIRSLFLTLALGALAPATAHADGEVTDPVAAQRDPDFAAGKAAIERKDWAEASRRFERMASRDPGNADAHNLLGYAYRNQGKYDLAFKHYERALVLDPKHKGAHEYIGETYLKVGNLAGAEKHLAELRRLCPSSCEELADLQREVAAFRARKPAPAS